MNKRVPDHNTNNIEHQVTKSHLQSVDLTTNKRCKKSSHSGSDVSSESQSKVLHGVPWLDNNLYARTRLNHNSDEKAR